MKKRRRKRLKIRGLVREARLARERLNRGLPLRERHAFLEQVRAVVEKARTICREAGGTVRSLPLPSRNALAELRRIATLSARDIPPPRDPDAPPPIRLPGVEGTLRRILTALGDGSATATAKASLFETLTQSVSAMEEAIRRAGSRPGSLPARSARAFAMSKWLASKEHFNLYTRQVQRALDALPGAARGGKIPDAVEVRFLPGEHIYLLQREANRFRWRFGLGFLDAGPSDFQDLARIVRAGKRAPEAVRERHDRFVHAPEFHRRDQDLEGLLEGDRYFPKGRAFDLEALYRSLNEKIFRGTVSKPALHWRTSTSRLVFGTYSEGLDLVCLNTLLDDPGIPRFVPESVLFHELLHKKHGSVLRKGRRIWHTRAFREEERKYPHLEEAKGWLDALSRGKRPVPPKREGKTEQLLLPFE
jgi:hypothetical protein